MTKALVRGTTQRNGKGSRLDLLGSLSFPTTHYKPLTQLAKKKALKTHVNRYRRNKSSFSSFEKGEEERGKKVKMRKTGQSYHTQREQKKEEGRRKE